MLDPSSTPASPISTPFPAPRDVVASYLRLSIDNPDLQKARLHLTKRSTNVGGFHAATLPAGATYTLGAAEADALGTRIPVNVKKPVPGTDRIQEMTVPMVVVQEDGQWKVDLPATMDRLVGTVTQALGTAASKAVSALDQAMAAATSAMQGVIEPKMASASITHSAKMTSRPAPKATQVAKPTAKRPGKSRPKPVAKRSQKPARPSASSKARKTAKKAIKKAVKKTARKAAKKPVKKVVRKSRR